MDNLRKIRAPVRAAITRNGNLLEIELAKNPLDRARIEVLCAILEEKSSEMETADHNIQEALIQDDVPEEEYTKECEEIDSYKEKIITYRLKANAVFKDRDAASEYADAMSTGSSKKKFRLPKLELQKFDGDLKDWLCFWSLFKKIHEDIEIDAEDKFQYLLQAITPGTRARELIDSYPPTAANYPKVVESLKQRFGREDLLVEVYVRELLRLVLHNATNPKEKVHVTKLYDQLESHIRALDTLGVTSEKCAAMLYPLVESCLPEDILRIWQRQSQTTAGGENADPLKNRLTNVLQFLRTEVEGEERIRLARAGFGLTTKKERAAKDKEVTEDIPTAAGLFNAENQSAKSVLCIFCEKKHQSQDCFTAQKMTFQEKKGHVQKRKCCFSCLKAGHMSKDCKHQVRCIICGQKHYPVMCNELPRKKEAQAVSNSGSDGVTKVTLANMSNTPEVLLKTLMVKIESGGKSRLARVVIDDGSHRSYILKELAEDMNLNQIGKEPMIHALFGGVKSDPVDHIQYEVPVSKLDGNFSCSLKMLDQTTICAAIPKVPRGPWMGELKMRKIWISDVGSECGSVDILLGADFAGKLMTGQVRHLKSGLVAIETKLGWTLMGEIPKFPRRVSSALTVSSLLSSDASVANLWKLEAIGIADPAEVTSRLELEKSAKEHFLKTVSVNEEGRYQVHLPWVEGHPELSTNRNIAEKRLMATTEKLRSNGRLGDYAKVFEEWKNMGIIERVPEGDRKVMHYLPHRAVFKENSSTTKVRPVFDASAHEKGSPSLNDCLEKGPNLIEEILSILIRFREKRIGVVADIAKAFLQISVAEMDRNFLSFLWWEDETAKKMVTFRHRRVVFGVSSSPFLLGAVLEYLMDHAPDHLKKTVEILRKSFYVDNCVSCMDDCEQLKSFINEAQELLALGKFDLRGWEYSLPGSQSSCSKVPVLGLLWDQSEDTLRCDLKSIDSLQRPVTKRKILSVAQQIFDPIGFLCPVTLQPKKLLQITWDLKAGWDMELPTKISEKFLKWANEIPILSDVKVPRWLTEIPSDRKSWSLHTFSDASKTAFAACVFLRAKTSRGATVQLVAAKSRVAPIKLVTIPRLELLSCVIGVRLAGVVKRCLGFDSLPNFHWTDSSTALCWIQRDDQWATFVGNRVKEIRASTSVDQWRHVPGVSNPADLPSRGCSSRQLLESRWWEGPEWLKLPSNQWPNLPGAFNEADVNCERRKTVTSLLTTVVGWSSVSKYFEDVSSYGKLVRRVALYGKFMNWLRDRDTGNKNLDVKDVEEAERKLLKAVQMDAFQTDPSTCTKGAAIVKDEDGLYRVKSKLIFSDEPKDFKLPILLPAGHQVTKMIILEQHVGNSHAGVQVMLSTLRERFWILRARRSIRQVLRSCVRCRRFEAESFVTAPAPLPKDRVREASVFEVVGVDLAGPLFLRGKEKAWVVLFTCAVYRAVHFELTSSLSTERFILALRRFIGRRGRPSIIFSDNGSNFVGAENLFRSVNWDQVETYSRAKRIQWRFNPPSAAWWGGWWERVVRMLKNHLRRVLGKASLDFEELVSILADVESVVNSRPLTYVSEDMEDLVPITPAMFLKDTREEGVPDMDAVDTLALNKRWQFRQKLRDDLRKRFRSEYLSQLVQRSPAPKSTREVTVGEIVLIGSDNHKRMDWPLGKILEVIPGKDGNSRVVRVKTAVGEYLRPIQRIYPLEVSSPEELDIEEKPKEDGEVEVSANCEESEKLEQVKLFKTRSGRVIKAPVKYIATHVSLFSHSV